MTSEYLTSSKSGLINLIISFNAESVTIGNATTKVVPIDIYWLSCPNNPTQQEVKRTLTYLRRKCPTTMIVEAVLGRYCDRASTYLSDDNSMKNYLGTNAIYTFDNIEGFEKVEITTHANGWVREVLCYRPNQIGIVVIK